MYIPGNDAFNAYQRQQEQSGGIFSKIAGAPIAGPGQAQSQSIYGGLPVYPFNPANPNPGTAPTTAPSNTNPFMISGAQNFAGKGGDWYANYGPKPTAGTGTGAATANPIYPGLTPPITGSGNIPNWPDMNPAQGQLQQDINNLLDPNNAQANFDVSMHGAERAAGTGTSGSPLATEYTGRLRQSDIERRTQLGANLLATQQDLALRDKFQTGQLSLQQAELALRDKIQSGQLSVEQGRLILDWYKTQFGGGGYGGGGGGGRQPGGSGAPSAGAGAGGGSGGSGYDPYAMPLSLPRAGGSATAPPPITAPDNWADLTPAQQADYAAQFRSNQANYGPNPYEFQEGNWDYSMPQFQTGADDFQIYDNFYD